ncbi:MAG: aminotransferase class V-fold PLP-dependent enzyme [Planctomycetes bacterium]|nr:aminotransferase class V-fold PLP-dependent enzyme [Planctomycetota bacterium]
MDRTRRQFLRQGLALGALAGFALRDDAQQRVLAAQKAAGDRAPEDLARDEDFWFRIQQAFDIDRSMIYLNNGGICPSPRVVQDALRRHIEYSNAAPARTMWRVLQPQLEMVRSRLARTFGCAPDEMAITRNTTESLETCIFGMDFERGDEILTTSLDYPRMIHSFKQRELREGIVLKQVPVAVPVQDPGDLVELFAKHITPKTKALLCCHIVFLTGQIFPVRDIARVGRAHGIPLIIDGAHAFAHLTFKRDDLECDYYGTSLHKWLTAPIGTGFLHVRKDKIAALWPLMGAEEPQSDDIRKFEQIGTHPLGLKLAISEALTFHDTIGPLRKQARLRYLRDRWARRLAQDKRVSFYARLEPEHTCAFVTFAIDGIDNGKLVAHLWGKHNIYTIAIDHEDIHGVRVTPNLYTTLDEIDMFCEAVEDVLANGLPA